MEDSVNPGDDGIPQDSLERTDALPLPPADPSFGVFETQPHGVSPSTKDLYDELRGELDRSVVEQEAPPYVSGTIDISVFVRALARFNLEQALFLREGRKEPQDQYVRMLARYSLAQDDYIRAMSAVLHQLGVI
jgi:hypothetical protein